MHDDNYPVPRPTTALFELRRRQGGRRAGALHADVAVDPRGRTAAVSLEDRRHTYSVLLSTRARHDGSLHVDLRVDRRTRNGAPRRLPMQLFASGRIARGQRVVLARLDGQRGFELALTVN